TVPHGGSLQLNVVPEFGTVVMMILVVSIMSITVISAKSKISLKL
ncbi:MAG: PEFG-CTERM domain-containing protein, partial [Nitrosopumilales archaeon CG_4_9_14_0_2_um_filter_34_16]